MGPAHHCSFAICMFPALSLSLTSTDCIISCRHLGYCWEVGLTATHEQPQWGPPSTQPPCTPTSFKHPPYIHLSVFWPCPSSLWPWHPAPYTKSFALAQQPSFPPCASDSSTASATVVLVSIWKQWRWRWYRVSCYPLLVERMASHMHFGSILWMFRRGGSSGRGGACHAQSPILKVPEHPQLRHQHCVPMTLTPTPHPNDTDTTPW